MIIQKIFIKLLVLLAISFQSCKEDLPPSTIIKVIVKDEKGNPIQSIPFRFNTYRIYATGITYTGSSKQETLFDDESQTDGNGKAEFSKTIPIKDGNVFSSFGFSEKFPYNLYKLKSFKKGSMIIDSVKYYSNSKLASFPESNDFTLPLVLSEINEYEITLQKK